MKIFMDVTEKFFLSPCKVQDLPSELIDSGERPVLHLLRRDLECLYLKEDKFSPDEKDQHKAPYLAAMGIMTGLDLMAKFYNKTGKSGEIFKRFLVEVCALTDAEADFAWDFRNALHHSYSLALKLLKNTIYTTAVNDAPWHVEENGIHYVNLWGFKRFFLSSVMKLKARIDSDSVIKARFEQRYRKAGCIFVQKQEKRPVRTT